MKAKNTLIAVAIILCITGSGFYWFGKSNNQSVSISTSEVVRGTVSNTVTATGTLEATETVVVGTQVSGVIEKIYVDFNSQVKKGQLVAELDKSTLRSTLETSEADLDRAKAELIYQTANLKRMETLFKKDMLAESEYDLAVYNYKQSKASLKSCKANVDRAKQNLGYANIYAPIDGVVLNRAVEEGQTVQASMSTPELFTITNDLKEMQVEADIDEADIGMVKEGQRVTFTVDAFPDDTFQGAIAEVRLQPTETSNVITYTVIVSVENEEYKLRPGMTASITDYVSEANNVLTIAGKALRFTPEREVMESYLGSLDLPEGEMGPGAGRGPRSGNRPEPGQGAPNMRDSEERPTMLWVKEGETVRPVPVEIGINDGTTVEILSGVEEGVLVVTSMKLISNEEITQKEESSSASSPFMPERPKGAGKGGPR